VTSILFIIYVITDWSGMDLEAGTRTYDHSGPG